MVNLIDKLRSKDELIFRDFFYQHKDALYKYAALHLRDSELAADIVQDVFTKFWNRIEFLDVNQNVNAYLFTIARHAVFEELRKKIQFKNYSDYTAYNIQFGVNNCEEKLHLKELENLYQEAISKLPEQRQKIFRFSKLQHLSNDEIADMLQISKNTVRDQLVKGNRFVKSYIMERSTFVAFAILFNSIS